ncbi:Gfo/Idh/MocA family oxidoreductase [Paraburkholderia sp. Ac-20336]|uniref:Gfo/Idh/MocA family protein n=1 Tax=Burkholderiaceae TaxID=119060 RepID=UPI0014236E11|nr:MULTISPECIES: Gfo/Idh/MocA family oxidoreductase [Burkholderiaceae]MBN3807406.1 Gfo/Idh/MocA family oxidoreductase [Paraburkholderia sp. Ac-20336]MBN3849812.1 Gfo/Idh/MocA family oxidoreductase [Paraburkholderia sp. Ac-20342]NIF54795.1 Gfo/Idh/MocA family oxidoreductase [Burkholderia sp. Ax-1724]NIF77153.1 Gfo/Idh/MocA family oxidoreductase [Paraburkholderia sp. Cy-641]
MDTIKPLRFGVLGAAKIARSFIAGVASSPLIDVVAVASRDLEKARQFASEVGVPRAHGSYEALLADPDIEAIYVPLPNTMHAEWVIKALDAGKHVLCEKPIAISKDETVAMFEAARRNGRFLAEAYPYRAQEQTLALRRLLDEGAIGRVQTVFACFGVKFSDPANIRLDPERGGGALLDAGSYAMSMVRMVAGEKPTRVNAVARWSDTKVDLTVIANLEFPSGLLAQIACSFNTAYHRHALISGTDGILETTFLNSPPDAGLPEIHLRRGVPATTPRETISVAGGNGFLAEAESYARAVALGAEHWNGSSEQESIDTIATLEAIARSIRSGNWENV